MTAVTVEPTDLMWATALIKNDPVLSSMKHQLILRDDHVFVEVIGGAWEARAWRHAINGHILPYSLDGQLVRRQLVHGPRMQVLVVEYPPSYPPAMLPDWIGGAR